MASSSSSSNDTNTTPTTDNNNFNPSMTKLQQFHLMFLRCELFNCKLAAKRIVKYWYKRVSLYGEQQAYNQSILDPSLYTSTIRDKQALHYGMFRTTNQTDSRGRPILFCDPSVLPIQKSTYNNSSIIRATCYMAHSILYQNINAQQKVVIIIISPKNVQFPQQFNIQLVKMFAESFQKCIPVRLSVMHFCYLPKVFVDGIFPLVKLFMGKELRRKIVLVSGTTTSSVGGGSVGGKREEEEEEKGVIRVFEERYDIGKEKLTVEIGGLLELDHESWLNEHLGKHLMGGC